jgi:DNA-binding CsgD family transcriptional regulator
MSGVTVMITLGMAPRADRWFELDKGEAGQVRQASRALRKVPAGAPVAEVFEAIRPCVPFAAGLLGILRPGAPEAMMAYPVGLPPPVLESWLGMPGELRARVLAPLFSSRPGELQRDSETVTGSWREELDVLRKLRDSNLGEGAGCKLLERATVRDGEEHFLLAIIMERNKLLSPRSRVMLAALTPAIADAVLRIRLPLVQSEPLYAQLMAERATGYLCVSRSGSTIAANSRAHELVTRFRAAMGIQGRRGAVGELAARAWGLYGQPRTWRLDGDGPPSLLHVTTHVLDDESHDLQEGILLVVLEEILLPKCRADELIEQAGLTPMEKKVARLLAHTPLSHKQVAVELSSETRTVETHAYRVYQKLRKLGAGGRLELMALAAN